MIHFKTLTLRNFLSYGNNTSVFNLDRPGTTLIKGIDLDHPTDGGVGANGVGKTTMINALSYVIYDKPISNISKEKLVNNINLKDMEVTVEFTDNHGDEYRIVRNRKVKGSAGGSVYFYKNGEDKTLDSIANTNTLIQSVIGLPHEMFVRIVVFSASHIPFLDLPGRAQSDLIEGLFGVTEISERAEVLKVQIKDNEARLAIKKAVVEQADKEQQRHKQQIISVNQRVDAWDEQTVSSIVKMKAMLAKVAAIDVEHQRALHEEADAVSVRLSACDTDVATKKRYLLTNDTRQKKVIEELAHLRDATCPYCLQHFAGGEDKIEVLSAELDVLAEEWTTLSNQSIELASIREGLVVELDKVKQQITVDNITELMKIASQSSSMNTQITELESAINPHVDTLNELLGVRFDDVSMEEIDVLVREIEHQKFLLKLLTKNDSFIRKALLNRHLPYLNTQLLHYVQWLGLPHKVEFMHNLEAKISQFDRPLDFGNLSAGQRARVNFALSVAFRDVLQRLHTKINVWVLDEVLDVGLDGVGIQAAARLVKHKAREEDLSMFVISHRDEVDGVFEHVMTIQFEQGFSYIKDEDIA